MRLITPFLVLAATMLVLVGCGGDDPTPTPAPAKAATAAAVATPTPAPAPTPTPRGVVRKPAATPTPTKAFDAEAHFKGQRVVINVGFSPGGGYDTFARLMGRYLPKHLPGNPSFVVRNIPGAGGERIFRETLADSAPDGFAVGVAHPRFFKRELVGTDVPNLDINTVKILGTASAVSVVNAMYAFKDYAQSWEDVLAKGSPAKVGATAPGDTGGVGASFVELVGGPIKNVYGYGGTSEIAAAFDRREIDLSSRGDPDTAKSLFPRWVEEKKIVPVFRWGTEPENDAEFTNYVQNELGASIPPHLFDVIELSDAQKALFNVTETINDKMNRLFIMHPDTPEDLYRIWVDAFKATAADPEFLAAAKLLGREVGYAGPDEMKTILAQGTEALKDPVLREGFISLAGVK